MSCWHEDRIRDILAEQDKINELRQLRVAMAWIATTSRLSRLLEWVLMAEELADPYDRED